MTTEITLNQIHKSRNQDLSAILQNSENYNPETVILAFAEIKKRGITVNEQMQSLVDKFTQAQGKDIAVLEKDFFQKEGFENYQEYLNASSSTVSEPELEEQNWDRIKRDLRFKQQEQEKKQAGKDVLYGGLWLAGGLIITIISLANGNGGIIAYGAVIFGGIQFFRGLAKS